MVWVKLYTSSKWVVKVLDKGTLDAESYYADYYFEDSDLELHWDTVIYRFRIREDGSWDIYEDNSSKYEKNS